MTPKYVLDVIETLLKMYLENGNIMVVTDDTGWYTDIEINANRNPATGKLDAIIINTTDRKVESP